MFTGIIKNLGKITGKTAAGLVIETGSDFLANMEIGASVAIDGICLTIVNFDKTTFSVDVMPETVKRTNLQYLQLQDEVNLEMPATANSFLAGHIVQGHIDAAAKLSEIINEGNSRLLKFLIPETLAPHIVQKGSIAVNGVSLTVIEAGEDFFTVGIIPHTWEKTMFHNFKTGDFANIETDVLAKYVGRIMNR